MYVLNLSPLMLSLRIFSMFWFLMRRPISAGFNSIKAELRYASWPGDKGKRRGVCFVFFLSVSGDADTPDKASVTTTAVEGKGKVNGATATSVGNETGCFRCAI